MMVMPAPYWYTLRPSTNPTWSVPTAATVVAWDVLFMLNVVKAMSTSRNMMIVRVPFYMYMMMVILCERFPELCPSQSTCGSCRSGKEDGQSEEFHYSSAARSSK